MVPGMRRGGDPHAPALTGSTLSMMPVPSTTAMPMSSSLMLSQRFTHCIGLPQVTADTAGRSATD
jgi:hypothetical protein